MEIGNHEVKSNLFNSVKSIELGTRKLKQGRNEFFVELETRKLEIKKK